jgi:hypothetical protein
MRRLVPVLAVLCASAVLRAQSITPDTSEIAPGDAIRVTAPVLGLKDWHGYLVEAVPDSVKVRSPDSVAFTIPISEITEFMVNHGNQPPSGNALSGLVIGGIVGGVIGVIAGTHAYESGCLAEGATAIECTPEQYRKGAEGFLIGALVGAGIGALIKTSHWQYVPIVAPEVTSFVAPNGATVMALQIRF